MGTTRAPSRVYNLARWLGEMERLSVLNSPLTEGRSVDDNNGVLDQGLGPHQLIVAGVVDNIDDPGLASSRLRGPSKVASVQPDRKHNYCFHFDFHCFRWNHLPECPVFLVATPGPEGVDPLGGELGHRRGAGQLELPLLPEQNINDQFKECLAGSEQHLKREILPDGAFLASCGPPLMPVVTRDTHFNDLMGSSEIQ